VAKAPMKCLILEENARARTTFATALGERGFDCHDCTTVAEASYLLRTHVYDVMLMDLEVSDGYCLPLVDLVDAMGRPTVVVLVAGTSAFPNGEVTALSPRIDYMLHKPVILEDLLALVEYATRSRATTH